MILKINGKNEKIEQVSNLAGLIKDKGLCPEKIVVEYNFRIVPKDEWDSVNLEENDNLEIVSFVGGG